MRTHTFEGSLGRAFVSGKQSAKSDCFMLACNSPTSMSFHACMSKLSLARAAVRYRGRPASPADRPAGWMSTCLGKGTRPSSA